jgi:hypothetical protein
MKRAVFGPRARFRLLEETGASGNFEIERSGGNGTLVARSLDGDRPRTFQQLELRRALAERRLQFHLEGRHVAASEAVAPVTPREPEFGALPANDRELAQRRYDAIRPLLGKPHRTAAEPSGNRPHQPHRPSWWLCPPKSCATSRLDSGRCCESDHRQVHRVRALG